MCVMPTSALDFLHDSPLVTLQVSLVRPVAVENSKDKPLLLYLPGDFPFVDQFHLWKVYSAY